MQEFTNPKRSFILSAPAGSGKTEKLARRYVSLLMAGSDVERILAITFTERAASEMKERILSILAAEAPELYRQVKPKVPLMRISTIHAFCLRLLRRFSLELSLEPHLQVADEATAQALWTEALYEMLRAEASSPGTATRLMLREGLGGWRALRHWLDNLYQQRPLSELLSPQDQGELEAMLLEVFHRSMAFYRAKKAERRLVDYGDQELYAYLALSRSPQWQNILYCFDEHTDHILVDEFQDTTHLQWRIIDKLTEEWRSGLGAKRLKGTTPTVFLVGDEKQSIYYFRGADPTVLVKAQERLSSFLGPEYQFQELRDNYRSLPEIVEFANRLFGRLMPGSLTEPWRVSYRPFRATRRGQGAVECVLLPPEGSRMKEHRAQEARLLARLISAMAGRYEVYEDLNSQGKRPCRYQDMAVLLKRRTHLQAFEDALSAEGVPFVVLKGVGFYEEPEVALMRELVCFLVEPGDDHSLFCLLRSPLFGFSPGGLYRLLNRKRPLLEALRQTHQPLYEKLRGWLQALRQGMPLSRLLAEVLQAQEGWRHFSELQRCANLKKFIRLLEEQEAQGADPLQIRDALLNERGNRQEAKANINPEEMNAVKLMTVHGAKGLQFPMVFLPSLDEPFDLRSPEVLIEEQGGALRLYCRRDGSREAFERHRQRCLEEEKRLFYVAVTRAQDYLFLSGIMSESRRPSRLAFLRQVFDLDRPQELPFRLLSPRQLEERLARAPRHRLRQWGGPFLKGPVFTEPLSYSPSWRHKDVTEDILVRTRHGADWVLIGKVMHQLLEELSKGQLRPQGLEARARLLIRAQVAEPQKAERILETILSDMERLSQAGIMEDIVLAQEGYAELSVLHRKGRTVYKGRVDRVVLRGGQALLYDYKSFPVKEAELEELKRKYRFQMKLYAEAIGALFGLPTRAFLVFTHLPRVLPLDV